MNRCDICGKKVFDITSPEECTRIMHPDKAPTVLCTKCVSIFERNKNQMETIKPIENEINHPSHYTQGTIETIEYIIDKLNKEQFEGYVIGNVIKYVSRFKLKGGYTDLRKAKWYIDKLLELEDAGNE